MSTVEAFTLQESDICYDKFLEHRIGPINFAVAGLGPTWLKSRGVDTAEKLKNIGYDSLHLASSVLGQCAKSFGACLTK